VSGEPPRGELGDLLRIQHCLKPADATLDRILQLLGHQTAGDARRGAPAVDPRPVDKPGRPFEDDEQPLEQPRPRLRIRVPLVATGAAAAVVGVLYAVLGQLGLALGAAVVIVGVVIAIVENRRERPVAPVPSRITLLPVRQPRWERDAHALDPPAAVAAPAPPTPSLLRPRWAPGIVAAMLATPSAGGPLDERRLVDLLARRELPERLPRRRRRTLSAGADVLVDQSGAMLPFAADAREVVAQIVRVLGAERVGVWRFDGDPLHAVGDDLEPPPRDAPPSRPRAVDAAGDDSWTAARYEPPSLPRAVLAVTNLGLSGGARYGDPERVRSWLELARTLRAARCPLIALVPFSTERIPPRLRSQIAVLEWDRTATAATARRAVAEH